MARLTISRHVQLDQVLEILNVWRQLVNFIVAQTELSQTMEPKEVLQMKRKKSH